MFCVPFLLEAVNMGFSDVLTHPETLALATFGAPSVEMTILHLGFRWVGRRDSHPGGM